MRCAREERIPHNTKRRYQREPQHDGPVQPAPGRRLGGRNTGGSYPGFVSGFTGTANDTLTIVSVSGDVVTARLDAQQTDGTVATYQGTYTVHRGVITGFDVVQVS